MKDKMRLVFWLNKYVENNSIPKASLSDCLRKRLASYTFEKVSNRKINLNDPKRFSEKIVWYMLFYDNPILSEIICKVSFKDYVKNKIGSGHTAELYGAWEDVTQIDWENLPKSFILKSNCSSFGRCIKFVDNKEEVDFDRIKPEINSWLRNMGLYSYGRGYYKITPKIFAEEIIGDVRQQPVDYKFFCFDGKPAYCYSAFEHFSNGKPQSSKIAFYDMEWNQLPVRYKTSEVVSVAKPKHFAEMKKAAEVLSEGFPFVRVDFYDTEDKFYVGELTFYSGSMFNSFTPDAFDFELGSKFVLPPKQKFKRIKRKDLIGK